MPDEEQGPGGPSVEPPGWIDGEPCAPIESHPPSQTLDWVESQLDSVVLDVMPLPGGLSSAIHRLQLLNGTSVVLRRYVRADWLAREPNIPQNETTILTMLPSLGLAIDTPMLVTADPLGTHTDVPAILMTEVFGRPELTPPDPEAWADGLAECLADIHATDPSKARADLGRWQRWDEADRPIPSWTHHRDRWQEAKDRRPDELPVGDACFLHRDFHPNNVHWTDGKVVSVVDWLGACIGDAAADLAHCRWNLAVLTDIAVAERFTDRYRELTGYEGDIAPYDLSTVLSAPVGPFPVHAWQALGRRDLTPKVVTDRIDGWLAHLLEG